jgi:hypothetical protein
MIGFGAGDIFLITPGTPDQVTRVGNVQESTVDIKSDVKELYGSSKFPIAVVSTKSKITGKSKAASLDAALIRAVLAGATTVTGRKNPVIDETGVVPTTPFQVTVSGSATWSEDRGVIKTTTGANLVRVASAPATGQYSVAAGVYTFAAADVAMAVKISYTKTDTTGSTTNYKNQTMGLATYFQLGLYNTNPDGTKLGLLFYQILFSGMGGLAFKTDDFLLPELEWQAMAKESTGDVFDLYLP